jgi:hypothetical protein
VSDTHAHGIVSYGVAIPPDDFKQPSRWYYRLQDVIYYDSGEVSYGITSMPNSMNVRQAIQKLLNSSKRGISCEDVRLGPVSDAHARKIMGNGVIIPPHHFKQPSCVKEVKCDLE